MQNTNIQIIEYTPAHAKAVAAMWNCSDEGWNGIKHSSTEESVRQKEAISSHLNLYLALDGDKVIGYCKLAKYFADESTLNIDLLNVDPAYHGKKAGKLLVLKSVERTIELGYPRLDLFTWAGNTKAVPLYKKCGFFWEKMESGSTHLMNFIPTVLETELLKEYFSQTNWYNDSNRVIEVQPDGRTENEFDFLTYSWHKDGKNLLVEFEKSGRGISKIETDDYSITTKINNNKLVFGKKHQVCYEVINKTGKPLEVEITGQTNKNINNTASFTGKISGSKTIEAEFFVDKIEIAQSIWKTHPVVLTDIKINGKNAQFKTGINPQFPLKLRTNDNNSLVHAGREKELLIDVENNLGEDCTFEIIFPKLPQIEFMEASKSIFLQKAERNTISVQVILSNSVLINHDIDIKATYTDGKTLEYKQKMRLSLNTYDGKVYGEGDHYYYMSYGKFSFSVDKHMDYNEMVYRSIVSDIWGFIGMPRFGKPFSQEFQTKGAYKSEFVSSDSAILLKLFYKSEDFPGAEAMQSYELNRNGVLKQWYDIISFPDGADEFDFCHVFNLGCDNLTMHYNGKLIKINNSDYHDEELDLWDSNKVTENWFFNEKDKSTLAFIWPKECKPAFCSWCYTIEHHFTKGGSLQTKPIFIAIDLFESVKEVREFALNKEVEDEAIYNSFDLEINDGNPFCTNKVSGAFVDYEEKSLEATVKISSVQNPYLATEQKTTAEEQLHEVAFEFGLEGNKPLELISAKADYYSQEISKTKAVFIKTDGLIVVSEEKTAEHTILSAANGILQIKSSPEFAPAVFSLTYKGHEWLDSDFPNKPCKSWWNPWFGGISSYPADVKEHHRLAEKTTADFVKITDSKGNLWEGIVISTKIDKFDALKGVTFKQYFLMLPNVAVIAIYTEVDQQSGFCKEYTDVVGDIFIKPDSDFQTLEMSTISKNQKTTLHCGNESFGNGFKSNLLTFKCSKKPEILHYYNSNPVSSGNYGIYTVTVSVCFIEKKKIKNGETKTFPPKFIIFCENELTEGNLVDLQNIRF